MRIRIFGQAGENSFPFGDGPWRVFRDVFETAGHTIVDGDLTTPADVVIAHSHGTAIKNYIQECRIPREKRVLVVWEPYIVDPIRYQRNVLDYYGQIYAPSIDWAKRVGGIPFKWPQDLWLEKEHLIDWPLRIKKSVMIQANKCSALSGEMYSLRRKVIGSLGGQLDLYGKDWNQGIKYGYSQWFKSAIRAKGFGVDISSTKFLGKSFENYLGSCESKLDTMNKYQICVVIENSLDYVSEKLFDAINAGCLTIYVGPNILSYGLPGGAVIQVSPNLRDIVGVVRDTLGLESKVSQHLAQEQRESLQKVWKEWNNRKVLSDLATNMLTKLVIR